MAVIKDFMNGNCRMIVHDEGICTAEEGEGLIAAVSKIIEGEDYRRFLEERRKREEESKGKDAFDTES